ncbi:hypothetical protein XENOCAPTIV_019136, partial [Xenoophorus captivus]
DLEKKYNKEEPHLSEIGSCFLMQVVTMHGKSLSQDHTGVNEAYEAMKKVASLINERKRRLESIDTIAHWQVAILHWELVYCKKDVLRRDLLHYRGRLDMDEMEVVDVPDGRDQDLGLTLKNALRLRHASTLELVCVLCCRKVQDKQRWLQAFAKERQRVKEDQEMGELCCTGRKKDETADILI